MSTTTMRILDSIPHQLKGRGHPQCVPMACDCGAIFLWEHKRGTYVKCPTCKKDQSFTVDDGDGGTKDDPAFVPHNGQAL